MAACKLRGDHVVSCKYYYMQAALHIKRLNTKTLSGFEEAIARPLTMVPKAHMHLFGLQTNSIRPILAKFG